jgi:hypothetical protein
MGKKAKIAIVVLISIFIGYLVLGFLNYVPFPFLNQSDTYPGAIALSTSIDDLTEGMDLDNATTVLLHRVTWKIYGMNGVTAEDAHKWFKTRLLANGWSLLGEDNGSGPIWNGYWSGWRKGFMGFFVAAYDGEAVVIRTGYDTAIVTGLAPIWSLT